MPDLTSGACREVEPELFFGPHVCDSGCDGPRGCIAGKSEQGRFSRIQEAKRVCMTCSVRAKCLDWAVSTNQEFGIWGGLTERERAQKRKDRRG